MMYTIYGIKNCDTMKKAFKWLDEQQINYHFHNYKIDGISDELLQQFLKLTDWQSLINTRGTTWRKLDETTKNSIVDNITATKLMLAYPSIIKRPILINCNRILLGFNPEHYQQFIEVNPL